MKVNQGLKTIGIPVIIKQVEPFCIHPLVLLLQFQRDLFHVTNPVGYVIVGGIICLTRTFLLRVVALCQYIVYSL